MLPSGSRGLTSQTGAVVVNPEGKIVVREAAEVKLVVAVMELVNPKGQSIPKP